LDDIAGHEILMGVAKTHSSLAKFTSRTEDHSFLQLCSGLKIMLNHWVGLNQTLEMRLLPIESLRTFNGSTQDMVMLGRVDYKPMQSQIDIIKVGSWIHFPTNNKTWIDVRLTFPYL
jgi:hypothetical protein